MTHHTDSTDSPRRDGAPAPSDVRVLLVPVLIDSLRSTNDPVVCVGIDGHGKPYFPSVPAEAPNAVPLSHVRAAGMDVRAAAILAVWTDRAHGPSAKVVLGLVATETVTHVPGTVWMPLSQLLKTAEDGTDLATVVAIKRLAATPSSTLAQKLGIRVRWSVRLSRWWNTLVNKAVRSLAVIGFLLSLLIACGAGGLLLFGLLAPR